MSNTLFNKKTFMAKNDVLNALLFKQGTPIRLACFK